MIFTWGETPMHFGVSLASKPDNDKENTSLENKVDEIGIPHLILLDETDFTWRKVHSTFNLNRENAEFFIFYFC